MARWRPHCIVVCLVVALGLTGALDAIQGILTDWRFELSSRRATGEVVLVAVDAPSLERQGVWPWPRTVYAELLTKLRVAGVVDVAFDIDFSSRSTPADDEAFRDALREFGGSAILPTFKQITRDQDGTPRIHVARPVPELGAYAWPASVNVQAAANGLVRRYAMGDNINGAFFPSLAALLAGRYDRAAQSFLVDYSIRRPLQPIPVIDVLDGTVDPARLKGKKIIIGATAIELGDRFHVPVYGNISGVELQVLAAESILQGRQLEITSSMVSIIGFVALAGAMLLMWGRFRPVTAALVFLMVAIGVEGVAHLLQTMSPVVLNTAPWIAGIAGYVLTLALIELDLRQLLANFAQNRFQSIALSLGDGVVCLDAEGRVTFWNPGARAIFGYSSAEINGRPFSALSENLADSDLCRFLSRCDASRQVIETTGVRNNGDKFPLEVRISSWLEGDVKHFGAIVRDISLRKRDEEHIRYLALHDALTGLANRAQIRDRLGQSIDDAKQRHETVALLLLDLDNFKEINDTLGHEAGDQFLCTFAEHLRACVGVKAPIARLGGDEFVVVVEGPDAEAGSKAIARSIADIFGDRHSYIDGNGFLISASIGSAVYPRDADNLDDLMANADLALYRAKRRRPGAHVPYESSFKRDLEHRRNVEAELARAVAENEFELFYQPQVRLCDRHIVGVEALIRWRHPTQGLVPPDQFLEILHACKLSNLVGSWVLRTACEQGYRWQSQGRDLRIGVNISPSQFHAELPATIERVLSQTGLAPDRLEIEVTEQILLKEDARTIDLLRQIRSLGVRIAFDDFGTGYASLSHLKRFPLDCLKVDRSFVRHLGTDRNNTAITTAIIELGNRMRLCTIAEGIEDEQSAVWLAELGCPEGQGYHFGKPMSVVQMQHLLDAQNPVSASAA